MANGMERKPLFTTADVWSGGHYELLIQPSADSSEELCPLLKALWSFPSLEGCYLQRDCDPPAQARIQPSEDSIPGHLYGMATLPTGTIVPCGSYTSDYAEEERLRAARWVDFYLPLGALSAAYPVGAYPFGHMDKSSEWTTPLNSFLIHIATWIHSRVPFEFALVGFEVDSFELSRQAIRAGGVPEVRKDGILWPDGGELKWYPVTRP
jgi:hypothetical protein